MVELTGSAVGYEAAAHYIVPVGDVALEKIEFTLSNTKQELDTATSYRNEFTTDLTQVTGSWQRVLFTRLSQERSVYQDTTIGEVKTFLIIPGVIYSTLPTHILGQDNRRYTASVELSGSPSSLGSGASYLQLILQGERIFDVSEKWHVRLRSQLGFTSTDDFSKVPVSARFFAGGDNSVRGFGFNELSPTNPDGTTGGRYLLYGTVELERDLPRNFRWATFYDIGNAVNKLDDALEYSVGVGLRWHISIASFGLDVGQPLSVSGRSTAEFTHLHFVLMKKRIVIIALIALLLVSSVLWWLCYTQSGLRFVLAQLDHVPEISIKIRAVSGRLARPLHIDHFELDHERVHIVADQIDLDLNPALLLSGIISVHGSIDRAEVTLKQDTQPSNDDVVSFLPHFLHLRANPIIIYHAIFNHYNGFSISASPASARLRLSHHHLSLNDVTAQGDWFAAQGGTFHLDSGKTLSISSQLNATLKPEHGAALYGIVKMEGDTHTLKFETDIQQPYLAHSTATLSFPEGAWLLKGQLESARWLLTPWLDNAPLSFSKAQIDYSLDDAGIHIKGNIVVPEWAASALYIDGDARYAQHVITLVRMDVSNKSSNIQTHTSGDITVGEGPPQLDLQSNWQYLQWPIQAKPEHSYFYSHGGTASIRGAMPYQFSVDAELNTHGIVNSALKAQGTLSKAHIEASTFDWKLWDSSLHGSAQLAFATPRAWRFAVQAQNIDPSSLLKELPGQISFTTHGSGTDINNLASNFDITLQALHGVLRKQNIQGQGHIIRHADQWQADKVAIHWGQASLTLDGTGGTHNDMHWHLDALQLQQFDFGAQGQLNIAGSLQGTREQPHLSVTAQSHALTFDQWKTTDFNLSSNIDLTDQTPSSLSLTAKQLSFDAYSFTQLAVNAQGNTASHELTLRGSLNTPFAEPKQVTIDLNGKYANRLDQHAMIQRSKDQHQVQWLGQLSRLDIQDAQTHTALDHPAQFSIHHDWRNALTQIAMQDFCLHVDNGHACASGDWQSDGRWQALASINQLPMILEHSAGDETTRLNATVNATVDLHQAVNQPWLGNAQLALSDAAIHTQLAGHDEVLPITTGTAHVNADLHGADASVQFNVASDTVAALNLHADRTVGVDTKDWPLHGTATLHSNDAKLVPVFVHEVDRAGGVLTGDAAIAGTVGTPSLSGNVKLEKGELDFYRWNLSLRELQLDASLNNDAVQFTAQGNAGQGLMNASGDFNWHDHLSGSLQLKGANLLVSDSPEYHILASPDLKFVVSNNNNRGKIEVSGDMPIPSARIKPQTITNAVQSSPDAHFKDDALYQRDNGWLISSNVQASLGNDVHFDGLGLQGQLTGEVATKLSNDKPATGRGELAINDGHYEAYGRKLNIKRGRLLFDNTPLDNPGLDIQAERVINDVTLGDITVGVNVRGLLRDPRLEFYSDPSMSQTQIVSYLVVGKPLDQLQGQETSAVRSATSSLAIQGGGYLAAQLGHRVGLEDVGVETDANNQSSLVLGKFLSPRLYVSYGISLTQAINTLKLRYSLSKHWTHQDRIWRSPKR